MASQAGTEYIERLRARAEQERALAGTLRDPDSALACIKLAEQYEAVAGAYDRLQSRR